jgi:ABC-type antimicrobial peptide transport system permease subunit
VWSVDRDQPVSRIRTMRDIFNTELMNRSTQLALVVAIAVLALVVASVGLYAVLSYMVAQRTAEIGLRMALGARRIDVVRGVLTNAAFVIVAGLAIGLSLSVALGRSLGSALYGITPTDVTTFGAVTILLGAIALLASAVPAWRAASISPVIALRTD